LTRRRSGKMKNSFFSFYKNMNRENPKLGNTPCKVLLAPTYSVMAEEIQKEETKDAAAAIQELRREVAEIRLLLIDPEYLKLERDRVQLEKARALDEEVADRVRAIDALYETIEAQMEEIEAL
jgi:hypothetical protein